MTGGVSPETCWASYKHGIINFDTLLHLVGYLCTTGTEMSPTFKIQAKVSKFVTILQHRDMTVLKTTMEKYMLLIFPKRI